jgi:ribosome-binding factor A
MQSNTILIKTNKLQYFCPMETKHQLKVSRLLMRDLGEIIQQEMQAISGGALVTVTKVNVVPDLSLARVYLSVFGKPQKSEIVAKFNTRAREIRGLLGHRVRHQLRIVPELRFFEDDSLDYIDNIENLLKED